MSSQTSDDLYNGALAAFTAGRNDDAAGLLRQASAAGHVPSMSLLGAQLLTGRALAPDPNGGAKLIFDAAARGGAYACGVAAAILAAGVQGPADWPGALDYLQRAAELGHAVAQEQLRILAGSGGDDWTALRRAVDPRSWRTAPMPRELSADPVMTVVDGLLSPLVCRWLILRSRDRLRPAQLFAVDTLQPVERSTRTNSYAPFDLIAGDLVSLAARERLGAAFGYEVPAMEGAQVFHYAVGQEFAPHFDFLEPDAPGQAQSIASRGQRIATILVYLNEDFEGGETNFPRLGVKFSGRPGDAFMFANVGADGEPDRRTLHAGLPPTSGEKWLLSQWVRDRAAPDLGAHPPAEA